MSWTDSSLDNVSYMAGDWPQLPSLGLLQQRSLADTYAALMSTTLWMRAQYAVMILLTAAVYTWAVATRARPGMPRLLACVPVLLAIHGTPLLFHHYLEPFATITATFLSCRMTCGKVLAFIMGRGVLMLPLSLPQFAAVMLAPFMPAQLVASRLSLYTAPPEQGNASRNQGKTDTARSTPENSGHGGSMWQQVTPMQRYSIDTARHSIDSRHSTDSRWSMESTSSRTGKGAAPAAADAYPILASSGSSTEMAAAVAQEAAAGHNSKRQRSLRSLPLVNVLLNAAVVTAFTAYTCRSKHGMINTSIDIAGLWVMWRAMECVMRAASRPAETFLGMTLAPHFRNPFASTSLTDFWARRWNITQGLVLRFFVYEPIVQGRLVAETAAPGTAAMKKAAANPQPATPTDSTGSAQVDNCDNGSGLRNRRGGQQQAAQPYAAADVPKAGTVTKQDASAVPVLAAPSKTIAPRWRRQVAAAATFVVSGIEHEIFMAYITHTWGWKWFVFFSLQGLLLAMESTVKRRASKMGLQLHPIVAMLAVLLALGVVGDAFFWPVLVQPKVVEPLRAALPEHLKELAARLQFAA